jgi:hypothetical protein
MKRATLIIAVLVLLGSVGRVREDFITNGGFETGDFKLRLGM